MGEWQLRRKIESDSNGFERNTHPEGGSGVMYEHANARSCEVYINGARFDIPWPDTSGEYAGDSGRPVNYRLRYESGSWWLYAYVYSGGDNRSEWIREIV